VGVLIATALLTQNPGLANMDGVQYFKAPEQPDCPHNAITSLPKLPNSIAALDVRGNRLASLPDLPTSLNKPGCGGNTFAAPPTPAQRPRPAEMRPQLHHDDVAVSRKLEPVAVRI